MSSEVFGEKSAQRATDGAESRPQSKKREDYLEWPEYFMAVAFLSAQRSKDPSSQVGACIVNPENKIVGIGYNGMPNGCDDDLLPWSREAPDRLDTKYPYVCHAELNAIMNKNSADVKGCTMYVALFPCNECAKLIIQAARHPHRHMRSPTDGGSPPLPLFLALRFYGIMVSLQIFWIYSTVHFSSPFLQCRLPAVMMHSSAPDQPGVVLF
uniref:Deoxycytidylate deaminase n=1 Tax=Scleropages formosus TaxID=113540 RepID=A0A8C9RSN5_SCLFO